MAPEHYRQTALVSNTFFTLNAKKPFLFRLTGSFKGNPPITGGLSSQRDSTNHRWIPLTKTSNIMTSLWITSMSLFLRSLWQTSSWRFQRDIETETEWPPFCKRRFQFCFTCVRVCVNSMYFNSHPLIDAPRYPFLISQCVTIRLYKAIPRLYKAIPSFFHQRTFYWFGGIKATFSSKR